MKNLMIYYFSILIPFPILIWASMTDSFLFTSMLFGYIVYRGFIDGSRLVHLRVIERKDMWKAFIPFWTASYFKEIYFTAA
jgi:hypothetical protein